MILYYIILYFLSNLGMNKFADIHIFVKLFMSMLHRGWKRGGDGNLLL